MPQQLQNLNIAAPAFKGLNTQDSPLMSDPSFAAVADNCVIDQYGRIGARKGFDVITTDATPLGSTEIVAIGYFEDADGNEEIFSAANNKIFSGTTTLTDITPAAYTITENDWKMVAFNNKMYFFQRDYEPLVYDDTNGLVTMTAHPNSIGTPPEANEVIGAYGRLWCADTIGDKQTVYWSDLLIGEAWSGGTSGSINISKVWPDGYDEIVALAAYNSFLIIFGRNSTVVYSGAESPATMQLSDTIGGLGCIERDSVQYTGSDLLFLSHIGLHSFGRTIQEKSMPTRDISKNVRNDFMNLVQGNTAGVKSVFSPENAFYLITLPTEDVTFCFDMRGSLEDGSHRVTRWTASPFNCFARKSDGTLLAGNINGVGEYEGYNDNGSTYQLRYFSNPLSFGDASRIKMLKKIIPTVIAGSATLVKLKWGYDFSQSFSTDFLQLPTIVPAEYNIGEYNIAEYSSTNEEILKKAINTTGNGTLVTVGVEVDVDGQPFSLQEFNIQALLGRMI
jgi:hypothetical protein